MKIRMENVLKSKTPIWDAFKAIATKYPNKPAIIDTSSEQSLDYGELMIKQKKGHVNFQNLECD